MSTSEDQTVTPRPSAAGGMTWRRLAVMGAYAIPILFILLMILYMEFIPFFIPFIVIFAGVGWWASRGGRASLIVLGVLAVIFIGLNAAPVIIPTLAVPASPIDFISTAWLLLAAITTAVASFAGARGESGVTSGPRTMERVVGALAVVAVLVSAVSFFTYDDAAQQEGDITLVTEDIEFQPETLEGDSGTVAVLITNNDPTYHTFTIDELDVHVDIPQNSTARVEFEADAGDYTFYCVPHEADMEGTLQVQ